MMGLKRVLHEEDLRLVPKPSGATWCSRPPGAYATAGDGRDRHRDSRIDTAARGDVPRFVHVGAGAVPLGAFQSRRCTCGENDFDADEI